MMPMDNTGLVSAIQYMDYAMLFHFYDDDIDELLLAGYLDDPEITSRIAHGRQTRKTVLASLEQRAEDTTGQAAATIMQKEEEEKECLSSASVDGHSIKVAETMGCMTANDSLELAPPVRHQTLQSGSFEKNASNGTLEVSDQETSASQADPTANDNGNDSAALQSHLPRTTAMQKCPHCGESFRSHETNEQTQIDLLDPQREEHAGQKLSSTKSVNETAVQILKRSNDVKIAAQIPKRQKQDIGIH